MAREKEKSTKKEKEKNLPKASNSGKYTGELKTVSKDIKAIIKDIGKVPKLDQEEIEKLLQAIALGLIPDRFGMEASLDTRVKALTELNKMREEKVPLEVNVKSNPLANLTTEE